MKISKLILIVLLFFIMVLINSSVFGAQLNVETENPSIEGTTLIINADGKIHNIKIYKKDNNGKFILFYRSKKEREGVIKIFLTKNLLSTTDTTEIKVTALDKDNNVLVADEKIDPIPAMPSMNPEETAKPTTTDWVIPTKPTTNPTSSASASPSETTNPSASSPSGDVEPTAISIDPTELTLTLGEEETAKLTYTLTPPEARCKLTWRTNASDIASIAKDGTVTAKSVGTTEISIRTSNGLSAECKVKVVRNTKNAGDALARGACELAYSNYKDNNGRDLVNSNGYYGTEKYRKYRNDGDKPHGCCSRGMASVINGYLQFDTSLEYTGAKEQYAYMAKSDKWKKIGTYKSGMENSSDSLLEPGDIVISTHHTCMYVGSEIPKEVYEESLKGTDADYGVPKDSAVWVSGGWHAGLSLCICSASEAHPSSGDGIIYRYALEVENTERKNSDNDNNTSIDIEHAKKVSANIHSSEHKNLQWHGKVIDRNGGMIGAYVEAINILNNKDYTLKEVYDKIISAHPEQKNKNVPVYENEDINDYYNISVSRATPNVSEIKKALDQGKVVADIVNTTKWRDENGNTFGKTGQHTGLIFYYDGKYYHMKTSVKLDAIYTEEQLKEWIGDTSTKLIIYSKK